jgi:uncharacterized membrane protein SirB2
MEYFILKTHIAVNIFYLVFFGTKTVMLFMNKTEALAKLRAKTKIVDIIAGTLILATGIYLLTLQDPIKTWLIVKIILVLTAIPLGIVGISKSNKLLAGLSLFILIYVYGVSETKSLTMKKEKIKVASIVVDSSAASGETPISESDTIIKENTTAQLENTKAIYAQTCKQCHGEDGALARFGAPNLQVTPLSKVQITEVITKGRGAMVGYEGQLSEAEIASLADLVLTFKK